MGFIAALDMLNLFRTIMQLFQVVPAATTPCWLSLLLMATSLMLFIRYYFVDNYDTRKRLVVACAIMMVANTIAFIGVALACVISPELKANHILRMLPDYLIPVFLWFYYRMICQ